MTYLIMYFLDLSSYWILTSYFYTVSNKHTIKIIRSIIFHFIPALYYILISQFIVCGPYISSGSSFLGSSLVAQLVKNLHVMWETLVQSLAWEGPLKKGVPTHSSILAWRIPWAEKPGGLQSMGSQSVAHTA